MKSLLVALMVMALAVPALAGQNPSGRVFVSFDPDCITGPYVHRTDVAFPALVDIYLVVDCFGEEGGMRAISLQWNTTGFGMAFAPVYYLPGAQVIGGPDDTDPAGGYGWTITGNDCTYPNECGIVVVLDQPYYATAAGTITLGAHSVDGKKLVDCNFIGDQICILANGGLNMDPLPGDDPCDCEPPSPVEDATWGAIKSLYR